MPDSRMQLLGDWLGDQLCAGHSLANFDVPRTAKSYNAMIEVTRQLIPKYGCYDQFYRLCVLYQT